MHMNSAPHLLTEDRPEFDRVLDEALRTAHQRPGLDGLGERLNAEQLRAMAIGASALLAAAAAAEYDHYVKVRGAQREEIRSTPRGDYQGDGREESDGAGITAMVAVLAPLLAATAMVIFLLVGYVLKAVEPEPSFAETMVTAGWLFGALTAVTLFGAVVALLVTAVRNRATEVAAADGTGAVPDEVALAREAWRKALLEQGILPFLREALADPAAEPAHPVPHTPKTGRIPSLGYTRPDFTGPGFPSHGTRPGYTPPDFTGPGFGGPGTGPH
ncbi:hypothetical protein [Streptomyces sp. NPDC007369]|uniref:hypothetical protein n=1 Tax=Streptomyces sp. NPDC007369 TaxID=3154589 RepID=UPI0033D51CC4